MYRRERRNEIRNNFRSISFPCCCCRRLPINNNTRTRYLSFCSFLAIIFLWLFGCGRKLEMFYCEICFLLWFSFSKFFLDGKTTWKGGKIVYHNQSAIKSNFDCYIITFLWSIQLNSFYFLSDSFLSHFLSSLEWQSKSSEELRMLIIEANRF